MRWFVSRHHGAKQWFLSQSIAVDKWVDHISIESIQSGDKVYGTLPVHIAYQVCQKGAEYYHLVIDLTQDSRGKELTSDQLDQLDAKLIQFTVSLVGNNQR